MRAPRLAEGDATSHPRLGAARRLVTDLAREWRDDGVSGLAAEVAFFWLLGLFPALLALAAALGSLEVLVGSGVAAEAEAEVVATLERVLTDDASATIDAVEALFADTDAGTVTFGLLTAVWASSRGFMAVVRALDTVYDLDERRTFVRQRALALALAVCSVLVASTALAMLVLGPLLGTGRDVADAVGLGAGFATLWDWARWPLAVVALVAWAATVLHVAPNQATPWRADVPGAVVAGVSWVAASVGLRLYVTVVPGGNQVLGLLGGPLIVLLWLYLLAMGLLLGGELNALLAERRSPHAGTAPPPAAPADDA